MRLRSQALAAMDFLGVSSVPALVLPMLVLWISRMVFDSRVGNPATIASTATTATATTATAVASQDKGSTGGTDPQTTR